MTTPDPATGHPAAIPRAGSGALPLSSRLLACVLLCTAAVPALAQQSAPLAETAMITASNVVPTSFAAPAISNEIPLPNRAIVFFGQFTGPANVQPVAASPAQPAAAGRVAILIQHALALLGTPYRWGGTGTGGFDCSGLVGYLFRSTLGIELPRVSRDMAASGQLITDRANLSPGDLVFFGRKGRVSHVGIYVGEGQFLHAPRTGRDVTVSSLESGYWSGKYMQARRVAGI